jgi:DNA-binding CsgD family transcriptional regulator
LGRATFDGRPEELLPLLTIVERVADGDRLMRLRAPESLLIWMAAARVDRPPRTFRLLAHDLLGLTQLALAGPWPVAEALLHTQRAKAEIEPARRRLEPDRTPVGPPGDDVRALVGSAITQYLTGPAAWQDSGWPPVDWVVARFDPGVHEVKVVAHPVEWAIDAPSAVSRRGRLFRSIAGTLQGETKDVGLSLDAPVAPGSEMTIGDAVIDGSPSLAEQVAAGERGQALRAALAALTDRQRAIVDLWAAGVPSAEIAARLGIAPGTARATVNQAVHKLRDLLPPKD